MAKPTNIIGHIPADKGRSIRLRDTYDPAVMKELDGNGTIFFIPIKEDCDSEEFARAILVLKEAGMIPRAADPDTIPEEVKYKWVCFDSEKQLIRSFTKDEFDKNFIY